MFSYHRYFSSLFISNISSSYIIQSATFIWKDLLENKISKSPVLLKRATFIHFMINVELIF